MASGNYRVLSPTGNNIERYRTLAQDYWKWIYRRLDPDVDRKNPNDRTVTFLRDDIIGGPIKHEVGISIGGPRKTEDAPLERDVSVEAGTSVFFPVYHVLSVKEHPYVKGKGGRCETIPNCKQAARLDLDNCYNKYARIDGVDIIDDLDYDIEADKFDIKVGDNNLNRELGFYLNPRPDPYEGIAAGTYLCLEELKPGTFDLVFGGRATDFHSDSIYHVTVTG